MTTIQHYKLETYGVQHGEAYTNPSVILEIFLWDTTHDLECRDTKTWASFWVHFNVSTLSGRVNAYGTL